MLKLKNVSKYYYQDGVIAEGFSKVNLELFIGEFVVITGESGSGKSTLLNVLSGLDTYEDGEMYINGEETSHYREEDYLLYRRKYVSNIFQNFNLVNSYTVYQNIELALLLNGKSKKEIKKEINELILKVGLKKFRNTHVSKLSGGQKQRVAIARCLASNTPIIVCDEPTGALDSTSSKEILELLHKISKDKLVIVVTHNKKEIEKYATRLIRMNDGKILENKIINKINLDNEVKEKELNDISKLNKFYLALRNAFNIPIKLLLMIIVFSLIIITLISNYSSIKGSEFEEYNTSYNNFFQNSSDKRIIITKKDRSSFTDSDYEKISNIDNVSYLVKEDILNDYYTTISNDDLYLNGTIILENDLKVSDGRLPEKEGEIIIKYHKDNYIISDLNMLYNSIFYFEDNKNKPLKIVGIIYNDDDLHIYDYYFYFHENDRDLISKNIIKNHNENNIIIDEYYFSAKYDGYIDVISTDKVPKGEVYIKDSLTNYCKNRNCLNKNLKLNISNTYYTDNANFKITNILNKNNIKAILDIKYNDYLEIYINSNDYDYLYNKGIFQSSVFVSDTYKLDEVGNNIANLGFDILKMKDSKEDLTKTVRQIIKILQLIVTIILVIVLFFISYFVIRLIYKSRNSYYATIRTLGGNKKVCISLLRNEIIVLASITYGIFILLVYLVNKNIINFKYIKDITKYVNLREYIIIYFLLLIISLLISYRYGRKIFKDSIIKTYGERL